MKPLVSILVALSLCLGALSASSAAEQPHVVLILVDDMGYGDPGCYNPASKIPTPNIDSLATSGMRFRDAHAPGALCHPSRYGLLTGTYPFRTDVSVWPRQPLIAQGQTTIGSLLGAEGYHSAMVGKWHLGFDEQGYEKPLAGGPVDRGFATFFGIRASTDIPPYFYIRDRSAVVPPTEHIEASSTEGWSPIQGAFWRAGGIAPRLELQDVLPRFTDETVDVIEKHAERNASADVRQPLFLYVAFPAPHTPWLPSREFVGKSGAGLYGDFAVMVDAMIGRVLAALDAAGMSDDTLIFFASDNGPTWYDRDVERFAHDSASPWRGMKADAWEAGHRVPFMVRWPGRVEPGSVSDQMICFTDVLATLAAVVGAELPRGAGRDSVDFSPVLFGRQPESEPIRDTLIVTAGDGTHVVRNGPWKLIPALGSRGFSEPRRITPGPDDPAGQLYNLTEDPGETKNLYDERPEIVRRLQAELERVAAQ